MGYSFYFHRIKNQQNIKNRRYFLLNIIIIDILHNKLQQVFICEDSRNILQKLRKNMKRLDVCKIRKN